MVDIDTCSDRYSGFKYSNYELGRGAILREGDIRNSLESQSENKSQSGVSIQPGFTIRNVLISTTTYT